MMVWASPKLSMPLTPDHTRRLEEAGYYMIIKNSLSSKLFQPRIGFNIKKGSGHVSFSGGGGVLRADGRSYGGDSMACLPYSKQF